jgi:hypothetical protein
MTAYPLKQTTMTLPLSVLAIGANASTVGMVLLVHGELQYWQCSRDAAKSADNAESTTTEWIRSFHPDVVVTEKVDNGSRKSERTQGVIRTIAGTATALGIVSVQVLRPHEYKNKYEEAVALARRHPTIKPRVPSRRFYDPEPKNVVLFEALALAEVAERNFAARIAAALG